MMVAGKVEPLVGLRVVEMVAKWVDVRVVRSVA
jgi:hypothetical protein